MFRQWESPAAVFQLLKRLSAGQPCDITGIENYEMLERCGGIQWPFPDCGFRHPEGTRDCGFELSNPQSAIRNPKSERRLFENGQFYHPDGRARFLFEASRPFPEQPNTKYPFVLLTGRGSAAQWHTQTRTAKSAILRKLYAHELYVEMNPHDARRLGVRSGKRVVVSSQRGRLRARAVVTPAVQPGQLFLPMHYDTTNLVTHAAFDPYSHQPAYKACAVAVEKLA
jgi:assimilatory nitrate reductase catalytic subunit